MPMPTIKVNKTGNIWEHGLGIGEHKFWEYALSGVTNALVNTTNIRSANYIGSLVTYVIGHG